MNKFFKIKKNKILVTGGAGFIGGALIEKLLKDTDSIIMNIDKLGYASDQTRVESSIQVLNIPTNRYKFVSVDLIYKQEIINIVNEFKPDIVFHLAAESHVDKSINSPISFLESNVVGTFNLLEACRLYWQKISEERKTMFRFLHVSTDEVFGSLGSSGFFNEHSCYDPRSPYSASKAASDHFVKAYFYTYGLPVLISNCSNNFGPWQYPEKLIPVIISNAINNKTIPIYGNGTNIRDWLYVEDHIDALITIIEKGEIGRSYCIGAFEEHTNIEITKIICNLLDQKQPISHPYANLIEFVDDRLGHDKRYAIDSTKIENELGWVPKYDFGFYLNKTVEWYLQNQDWCQRVINK